MNKRFKQRLVGIVVLVALAISALPFLLDGAGLKQAPDSVTHTMSQSIPVQQTPIAAVTHPKIMNATERKPEISQEITENSASKPPPTDVAPSAKDRVLPAMAATAPSPSVSDSGEKIWSVQLGSFTRENNATSLAARLKALGYPAKVGTLIRTGNTIHRVTVGADLSFASAKRLRDELDRQLQIKGVLVQYP